jgi:predicted transcriptional regulator
MRIKKGFTLRRLCGQDTVMAQGTAAANFGLMLQLSEAAAWLWREAERQGDFTVESLAEALCEEYDITPAAALSDVAALTSQWQQVGVVDATSSAPRQ